VDYQTKTKNTQAGTKYLARLSVLIKHLHNNRWYSYWTHKTESTVRRLQNSSDR